MASIADVIQFVSEDIPAAAKVDDKNKTKNKSNKHFCVFVCGPDPHPHTRDQANGRGQHYIDLLKTRKSKNRNRARDETQEKLDEECEIWSQKFIYQQDFPTASEIASYDAIIVSGSKYDAHDLEKEWIAQLRQILHHVYEKQPQTKLLGICFGHQIIANALNHGQTGRNPNYGNDKCVRDIQLNADFFAYFNCKQYPQLRELLLLSDAKSQTKQVLVAKAHRDVVLAVPRDGIILATSCATDIEIFAIGQRILCLQGHPEWTPDYIKALYSREQTPPHYVFWQYLLNTWLNL
jgi:GMP synthase-like glutamine amidotransferase